MLFIKILKEPHRLPPCYAVRYFSSFLEDSEPFPRRLELQNKMMCHRNSIARPILAPSRHRANNRQEVLLVRAFQELWRSISATHDKPWSDTTLSSETG